MPATKTSRRQLRVSPSEDALFRQAAAAVGESVSHFLVESGRERAEAILADRTQFTIEAAGWQAFSAALDAPANASPAVAALMRRPPPQ